MTMIIYSKPDCPWCVKAKQLLNDTGFSYKELMINKDYTKDDLRLLVGENKPLTVPQVVYNGKLIGGYESLLEYMEEHNIYGVQN